MPASVQNKANFLFNESNLDDFMQIDCIFIILGYLIYCFETTEREVTTSGHHVYIYSSTVFLYC
jgi:hypothetical protein